MKRMTEFLVRIFLITSLSIQGVCAMAFELTSPDFIAKGQIPSRYTCDGQNVNPQLEWRDPPANTRSFVLIVADPDAPAGTWYHWVLYNLPKETRQLTTDLHQLPDGASVGKNSWGKAIYQGPCPPDKEHRYIFSLYALDRWLEVSLGASVSDLRQMMEGHILGQAQLIGVYKR